MRDLLKSLLFVLLESFPFGVTLFLNGNVSEQWRLGLFLVFLGIALPNWYYREVRYARVRKIERFQEDAETVLSMMLQIFLSSNMVAPEVRANVMLLRKEKLKIVAYCGHYREAELEMEWQIGQGACGRAIAENKPFEYDAESERGMSAMAQMTAVHREITRDIRSVVSFPIYPGGERGEKRPVGVLNLDCHLSMSSSGLNQETVRDKAMQIAGIIGRLL